MPIQESRTLGRKLSSLLNSAISSQNVGWELEPEILLCPQVPKPIHGLAPRVVLGKEWWDKERRECYQSTNFHCKACGISKYEAKVHQWLEGHELYGIDYARGVCRYLRAIPLCHLCHNYIHDGRLQSMLDKENITKGFYIMVKRHGDKVLRNAGLVKPPPYEGPSAEWSAWRLEIENQRFPPVHKTFEDWKKFYGVKSAENHFQGTDQKRKPSKAKGSKAK